MKMVPQHGRQHAATVARDLLRLGFPARADPRIAWR